SIYCNWPVIEIEQVRFLNMVAEIGNPLPAPEQVMARLLRIEYSLGRTREVKDGPRTIDLDLLLYGEVLSDTQFLKLPHPCLHERRFVLEPLAEIAPRLVHPKLKRSAIALLESSDDQWEVKRWGPW